MQIDHNTPGAYRAGKPPQSFSLTTRPAISIIREIRLARQPLFSCRGKFREVLYTLTLYTNYGRLIIKEGGEKLSTDIFGKSVASLKQARLWWGNQCPPEWTDMPDRVWGAAEAYGIRPDFTLAQIAHETNFCKFGGDVKPVQNNFAGIGATGGGNPGHSFADRDTGIHAVLQHEWAYATDKPLIVGIAIVDPRFKYVHKGSAPCIEFLGASDNPTGIGWAYPGKGYGAKILLHMGMMAQFEPLEKHCVGKG